MKHIAAGMPRTTKIMGQTFTVTTVHNLHVEVDHIGVEDAEKNAETIHDGIMPVLGVCDRDALAIMLDPDAAYDRFRETFLHEHLHAMIAKASLHTDVLARGVEENAVARLAPILLQFLRDNPKAVAFMTDRWQGGARSA